MGAGYSGYQQKTGIAKDQLPENLAEMADLAIPFSQSTITMDNVATQNLFSKYSSTLLTYRGETGQDKQLLFDYVPKKPTPPNKLLFDYKPVAIPRQSTLYPGNTKLINYSQYVEVLEPISTTTLCSKNRELLTY